MAFRAADDVHARLRAQVLAGDPERGEAALFAAPEAARRLIALYAFNLEVAKAWESVSEPTLGLIRLTWWREALAQAKAGEGVRRHDAAEGLAEIIAAAPEIAAVLETMIDARERDFDEAPFADEAAFRAYVDATAGGLARAALILAGAGEGPAEDLARPLGRAWGTLGLLRAMPWHLSKGRLSAPGDGVDAGVAFAGGSVEESGVAALRRRMGDQVEDAYARARTGFRALAPDARPAALYGALIPGGLKTARRAGAYDPPAEIGPLRRKATLTKAALTARI